MVIYELVDAEWSGDTDWAEMHLFVRKTKDGKAFRLVAFDAWAEVNFLFFFSFENQKFFFKIFCFNKDDDRWKGEEIILNVKLKTKMTFEKTSEDFCELRGADRAWGMYFASATQANETVSRVISSSRLVVINGVQVDAVGTALTEVDVFPKQALATFKEVNETAENAVEHDIEGPPSAALEKAKVHVDVEPITSRPVSFELFRIDTHGTYRCVSDFKHDTHVTFNAAKSRYEGLPDGWAHVNKQYGVALEKVPRGDDRRVPTVLLMLEDVLREKDGFLTQGIFRIAPDGDDCAAAKEAIDSGDPWDDMNDVHVVPSAEI